MLALYGKYASNSCEEMFEYENRPLCSMNRDLPTIALLLFFSILQDHANCAVIPRDELDPGQDQGFSHLVEGGAPAICQATLHA